MLKRVYHIFLMLFYKVQAIFYLYMSNQEWEPHHNVPEQDD